MSKVDKLKYVLLALIGIACGGDFFPQGLYDYQVERLLSADSSKVWNQVMETENCADSTWLYIEMLASDSDDSVAISEVLGGASCDPDTSLIGYADASAFSDELLFTDSLNFDNGMFWLIEQITSERLILFNEERFVYSGF